MSYVLSYINLFSDEFQSVNLGTCLSEKLA